MGTSVSSRRKYEKDSDEILDEDQYLCAYCIPRGKPQPAVHYCYDCGPCGRYYCGACAQKHNRKGDNHVITRISDVKQVRQLSTVLKKNKELETRLSDKDRELKEKSLGIEELVRNNKKIDEITKQYNDEKSKHDRTYANLRNAEENIRVMGKQIDDLHEKKHLLIESEKKKREELEQTIRVERLLRDIDAKDLESKLSAALKENEDLHEKLFDKDRELKEKRQELEELIRNNEKVVEIMKDNLFEEMEKKKALQTKLFDKDLELEITRKRLKEHDLVKRNIADTTKREVYTKEKERVQEHLKILDEDLEDLDLTRESLRVKCDWKDKKDSNNDFSLFEYKGDLPPLHGSTASLSTYGKMNQRELDEPVWKDKPERNPLYGSTPSLSTKKYLLDEPVWKDKSVRKYKPLHGSTASLSTYGKMNQRELDEPVWKDKPERNPLYGSTPSLSTKKYLLDEPVWKDKSERKYKPLHGSTASLSTYGKMNQRELDEPVWKDKPERNYKYSVTENQNVLSQESFTKDKQRLKPYGHVK